MADHAPLLVRARFRAVLWLFARLLPALIYRKPLNTLLAGADAWPVGRYPRLPVGYIVKRVRRTTRRPWLMRDRRCLREGLLAFRFLTAAGYAPELHFGVERASFPGPRLRAYCWVVAGGATVLNDAGDTMALIHIHRGRAAAPVDGALAGASFD